MNMNKTHFTLTSLVLGFGRAAGGAGQESTSWDTLKDPQTVAQLKAFVAEKTAQADVSTNTDVPGFAPFFAVAARGDWLGVSNAFAEFRKHAGQYEHSGTTDERLRGVKWQAVIEIRGAFDACYEGDEKYAAAYAVDIIGSLPPGSIDFGGTDPGRFLITGMQKSHVHGDPFFTLTQNALADNSYVDYARCTTGIGSNSSPRMISSNVSRNICRT